MKLEIPSDDRGFRIQEQDDLILISPGKTKMGHSDWLEEDLPYRSVVLDKSGNVISSGFKKFFNYGEDLGLTAELNVALELGDDVWFTEKVDGSLAIRDVINGQVNWRTRGTISGGDFRNGIETAAKKYPILADVDFYPDHSLLFEFVSPDHRVVIRYDDYEVVLLAMIRRSDLKLIDLSLVSEMATKHSLKMVEFHDLPTEIDQLVATVKAFPTAEGIVVRWGDNMLKLKSAQYLLKHRIKFALTNNAIREACVAHDVWSLDDFENYLKEIGGDWELAIEAKPLVEKIVAVREQARQDWNALLHNTRGALVRNPVRKDFALNYALKLDPASKTAAFLIADGKEEQSYSLYENQQLDQLLDSFKEVIREV